MNSTVDRRKTWNEGPPGTEVEGLAAAYRDRFSLKSARAGRRSGTDGRRGQAIGAWLERVCGRLRRPQSRRRVAVRAEVPWAAKVLRGLEPSWRDWRRRRISEASGRTPE